jgi:hypothetical protein
MKRLLGVLTLASLVGVGCIKKKDLDFKNLTIDNWQPDWALPVLNSNMTLKDMLPEKSYITEDAEGVYSLHYTGDLFYAKASDYIKIPDQNYTANNLTLTTPLSIAGYTGTVNDTRTGNFAFADASGAQLAHLNIKTGLLTLNVNSTFQHNVAVTITFPKALKGGVPLSVTTNINFPATSNTATIDLSGYNFDLSNGGTTKNNVPYEVRTSVTGTGNTINSTDNISASISMTGINYSFIDGFLGQYDIPIAADTINIGVFDNTLNANIFVNDPKINLSFKNSIGLNVSTKFDNLYGVTATGVRRDITISDVNVAGATSPGLTSVSTHVMDSASTNGAVQNLFNPAPNHVIYNGRVRVNPGGVTSTYSFVTDSSAIALTAEAELPAWFKIITFTLQDTTKLTLPEDTSILQKAEFKMLMDNALPLYGRVQLYFADENFNVVDSLVPTASDIIGEAPVDAQGKVNGRKTQVTTFTMEKDQYNAMAKKVRHAIIKGELKSSGTGSVKIQSSNNLIVKLAFRFKLNVEQTNL